MLNFDGDGDANVKCEQSLTNDVTYYFQNTTQEMNSLRPHRLQRQDSMLDLSIMAKPNWTELYAFVRETDFSTSIMSFINENIGVVLSVSKISRYDSPRIVN